MCTRDTKYKHQLWTGRLYRRGLLWLSACIIIIIIIMYKREGRQHGGPEATRPCWPNELLLMEAAELLLVEGVHTD